MNDGDDNAQETAVSDGDRRRETRAPIQLRVEYKRLNSFVADYTKNISRGGTFIATQKPLAVGTEFLFELTVPSLEKPLELLGVVTWIVDVGDSAGRTAGMGIKFRYNDAERDAVHRSVETAIIAALGPVVGKKLLDESAETSK